MANGFCSWSGGKDSCLALYKAMQTGFVPNVLLTMCIENGERSRSHGLSLAILQAQADALETSSGHAKYFLERLSPLISFNN